MTTTGHAVAPEEVMAWVDGELPESEARAMAAHVEDCAECAGVAAEFQRMSEELAEWRVAEVSGRGDAAVMRAAEAGAKEYPHGRLRRTWGARWWWMAGGAVAMVLVVMAGNILFRAHPSAPQALILDSRPQAEMDSRFAAMRVAPPAAEQRMQSELLGGKPRTTDKLVSIAGGGGAPLAATQVAAPMIARTVSLTVRVKSVGEARTAMEAMLARHHGYTAQMNANTAEGSARMFSASVRIPAGELETALKEFRMLGRVDAESQTGEEVTQQHEDLAARLKTARETEARFQGILEQRTGNISDVLEVEQEIARVRGEIESMEAEQAGLEHRVEFASVELMLMENYQARLSAPDSVGTRLRNAFVEGYENGWGTLVGMVVFAGEYGPAILIWVVVLGLPCVLVWRRYRRMQG